MAMWSVVAWHCYCGSSIEKWFIPIFCYWSVPWFFLVSGFFFVTSYEKRGMPAFALSKFKSLFVPYVVWCVIGFLVFTIISPIPVDGSIVSIFAIGEDPSPAFNPPLWYIRALLIFTVIGGVALYLMSRVRIHDAFWKMTGFCILFCMAYGLLKRVGVRAGVGSAPAYFLAGIILQRLAVSRHLSRIRNLVVLHAGKIGTVAIILAIVLRAIWFMQGHSFSSLGQGGVIVNNLSALAFIIAIWQGTSKMGLRSDKVWCLCGGAGVFVYLMHRPFLMCMVEALGRNWFDYGVIKDVIFVVLIMLYVPLCLCVGWLLYRTCPKCYSFLIGGR